MKDTTFELYAEHCLALTYEKFNILRQEDMIRMSSIATSPQPGPTTPMTTLTGHTKGSATSESQIAFNNFKRGTRTDGSAFPIFKNHLYYEIFQRSFMATIKAQGLYDVADPDFYPTSKFSMKSNLLHILFDYFRSDRQRKRIGQGFCRRSKNHHFQALPLPHSDRILTYGTLLDVLW